MHTIRSIEASPNTHVAFSAGKHAEIAQDLPRQNRLLAALPPEDYARLLPDLEPVSLPQGSTVYGNGDRENYLYFLTRGIVARLDETEDGRSAISALEGNEGVVGIASYLGGQSTPSVAVVLSAGHAYRVRTARLKNNLERGTLLPLLLRYTMALTVQIAQSAACNRHHSVDQRLCGLILSCLDRLPANDLAMTQERISEMLGVRREGITGAAGNLHSAGLINYSRGHITVLDRPGLEKRVCECYAVVKREYDRLIPVKRSVELPRPGHSTVRMTERNAIVAPPQALEPRHRNWMGYPFGHCLKEMVGGTGIEPVAPAV